MVARWDCTLLLANHKDGTLGLGDQRRLLQQVIGKDDLGRVFLAADLGLQPRERGGRRPFPLLQLRFVGGELGVVEDGHDLAGFDDVALAHVEGLDLAALHALDHLGLAGGDDLALAARDLVQHGVVRPHQADHHDDDQREQQQVAEQLGAFPLRLGRVDPEISIGQRHDLASSFSGDFWAAIIRAPERARPSGPRARRTSGRRPPPCRDPARSGGRPAPASNGDG